MEIEEFFQEDPEQRNKFKAQLPQAEKEVMVYDYFEQNSKKQQVPKKYDPASKGFDIRAFRMKQAQTRGKGGTGLGDFKEESFGIVMPDMRMDKEMKIEGDEVIKQFNDEEAKKRDDEWADQKRTTFQFGGMNVKDRIRKRKMQSKIGNEAVKLERILSKRGR